MLDDFCTNLTAFINSSKNNTRPYVLCIQFGMFWSSNLGLPRMSLCWHSLVTIDPMVSKNQSQILSIGNQLVAWPQPLTSPNVLAVEMMP